MDSGCTWVIPSSHLSPRVGVPQIDGGGTWMDEHPVFDHLLDQMVPIPTKPGDMLVFNGLTFHTVGYNNTDKTRKSAIFGVRAVDEQGFVDPKRELLIAGNAIYRGNDLKRIVRDPEVIKAIQQGVPIRSNEYLSGLKGLSDVIDLLPDGRPIDGLTHVLGTHGSKGLRLDVPNFVITEWNLRAVRRALASNIRQNDQSLNFFKRRSAKVARNLLIELQGYEEPTPPDINILLDVLGI